MKTLGALAVIWILYSMYRVAFGPNTGKKFYEVFAVLGWFAIIIGIIIGIIYLIITYLP